MYIHIYGGVPGGRAAPEGALTPLEYESLYIYVAHTLAHTLAILAPKTYIYIYIYGAYPGAYPV